MAWYHQYQYAEVTDPLYRNLRGKALPIIQFEIISHTRTIISVKLSFGNNSSMWFESKQVCLYKSGSDLIKLGNAKRDISFFNRISNILKLRKG